MTSIRELHVVLSDYCNIKCNYCSVYKRKDVSQYIIDKEAFKLAKSVRDKALLESVHFDIITLTGGETTTISPSVLATCVNILQDVCNIVSIQTNGVAFGRHQYFNSFTKNIKNKYKLNISISCDGPQSIHDLNRDNSYKFVNKAIDNSIKYIGEVGLVCVVGKHTVENKDMFESWIETILKNKAIHPQIRVEMGKNRMTDSDQVKLGKIIVNNGLYPYSEVGRKTTLNKGNDCDTLVVSTNTIVRGCLKFTNTEVKLDMTSINENTFDEIVEKRKNLFSTVLISEDCKTCKYKDICNSGCPLFRKTTGKANECFLRKTVYKEDCNLYGEESGCFKKVTKSVKKGVKSVGKTFKKAAKSIFSGVKAIGKASGALIKHELGSVGKVLSFAGLDSLGKEVARWGEDVEQVMKVLSGKYYDDVKEIESYKKKVEDYGNRLNTRITQYNLGLEELLDRLEGLVAFDEIFKMAYSNRIGDYQEFNGPELEIMTKQYELMMRELKRLIADLKSEYDFVIGLTEGAFVQRIIGSLIMIAGGLTSDLMNIASGDFDSKIFTRILMIVIAVVMIVLSIFTGGSTLFIALAIILLFLNLDAMYANGAATGAIMSALDFIFNDLLNLDDLIGSDFEKFDKDHEDYQEMVGYVKLSLTIATIIAAWGSGGAGSGADSSSGINAGTAGTYGTSMGSQQTSMLAAQDAGLATNTASYAGGAITVGDSLQTSAFLGVKFTTYASLYEAYNIASGIKDVISQNKLYKEMEERLKSDLNKVDEAIVSKTNKNMMKHYKDTAYFLQDQQAFIDRYVWGMTEQQMYVDPYGTTPVANIRFTPDKDTRMMSFGFEDVFDESTKAGSKGYFNNILYR